MEPRRHEALLSMLELSTAHLRREDVLELPEKEGLVGPVRVVTHAYGWFVPVPDLDDDTTEDAADAVLERAGLPTLAEALRFAYEHGATWIYFDADADTVAGLPTYDW